MVDDHPRRPGLKRKKVAAPVASVPDQVSAGAFGTTPLTAWYPRLIPVPASLLLMVSNKVAPPRAASAYPQERHRGRCG